MRPNSVSLQIIQLFDLVSNCNTGEAVRTDTMGPLKLICICRGSTWETFSLSSLNAEADLCPVCVFALETQPGCCKHKVIEKTSTGDRGVFLSRITV